MLRRGHGVGSSHPPDHCVSRAQHRPSGHAPRRLRRTRCSRARRGAGGRHRQAALPGPSRRRHRSQLAHRGQRRVAGRTLGTAVPRRGGLPAPGDSPDRVPRLRLARARTGHGRTAPGLHPREPLRPRQVAPPAAGPRGSRQRPRRPVGRLAAPCHRRSGGDGLRLRPALRPRGRRRPTRCSASAPPTACTTST